MNTEGKHYSCGRRNEDDPAGIFFPGLEDGYREDNCCTYCGSFNPEVLMKRLEAGDVEIGPTDKNYKVYLRNRGGEPFKQTYRNCPSDARCTGPNDCTHWVTREISAQKFYFQHFSAEQQQRFIELLNAHKVHIGVPGHFYVLPYFCRRDK